MYSACMSEKGFGFGFGLVCFGCCGGLCSTLRVGQHVTDRRRIHTYTHTDLDFDMGLYFFEQLVKIMERPEEFKATECLENVTLILCVEGFILQVLLRHPSVDEESSARAGGSRHQGRPGGAGHWAGRCSFHIRHPHSPQLWFVLSSIFCLAQSCPTLPMP
jgi:hypothetical protein